MRAPTTAFARIMREVEFTPTRKPMTHLPHMADACSRCGGLLVDEYCLDMDIGKIGRAYWAKRCIQCGDMIDETILRHRDASYHTLQETDSAAEIGQAFVV